MRTFAAFPLVSLPVDARLICGLLSSLILQGALAHGAALNNRFREEYPAEIAAVVDFYKETSIRATRNVVNGKGVSSTTLVEYASSHGCSRKVEHTDKTIEGQPVKVGRAVVFNPESSFSAVQENAQGYSLSDYGEQNARKFEGRLKLQGNPTFAAYCFYEQPITEFMALPSFKVLRTEEVVSAGRGLLKVYWEANLAKRDRKGWFVFDPQQHWVLHEFVVDFGPKDQPANTRRCRRVKYSTGQAVPVVHSVEHEVIDIKHDKVLEREVVTVDEFDRKQQPLGDFTAGAFGVKLPAQASQGNRWWLILNGFAVLAIGLVLLRKYFKTQAGRGSHSPAMERRDTA